MPLTPKLGEYASQNILENLILNEKSVQLPCGFTQSRYLPIPLKLYHTCAIGIKTFSVTYGPAWLHFYSIPKVQNSGRAECYLKINRPLR